MALLRSDVSPSGSDEAGFLNSGLPPADTTCCGFVTLRRALFVVIALDVLLGVLYLLESILLILVNGLIPDEFTELVISLVGNSVSVLAVPFALVGFRGLKLSNWRLFHVYFLYKSFETFFICLYSPATSYIYCYNQGWKCEAITLLCLFVQKIGVDVYFTYLAWSQDICFQTVPKTLVVPTSLELMRVTNLNETELGALD